MHISRGGQQDGPLVVNITNDPLREVNFIWHDRHIDVLSLPCMKRLRSGVFETLYEGRPAVAKIACFEWLVPNITRERWAYDVLSYNNSGTPIAPRFQVFDIICTSNYNLDTSCFWPSNIVESHGSPWRYSGY